MRDIKEYLLSKADCSTIAKLASASIKGTRCFSKSLPSIKQELAGRLSSCEETCNYINWTSRLFLFIKYCYIRLIATECFKREFHSSPLKIKIIKKKKKKRNETINRHAIYPKVNLSSIFFSFVILRVFRDLDAKWNTLCTRSPSTFIFAKETSGSGQPSIKEAIEILGKLIGKRATPRF